MSLVPMSSLLDEDSSVFAAASVVVDDPVTPFGERPPENMVTSGFHDPQHIAAEQTANADAGTPFQMHAKMGAVQLSGATASGLVLDGSNASSLIADVEEAFPADFEPAPPTMEVVREPALIDPDLDLGDPGSIASYRAHGIAAISVLLADFPVASVPWPEGMNARTYAQLIEVEWLNRIRSAAERYCVRFPDGTIAKLEIPSSDRHWYDFAFVSLTDGRMWPANLKAGASQTRGDLGGEPVMTFLIEGVVPGQPSGVPEPDEAGLLHGPIRDYFVVAYDHQTGVTRTVPLLGMPTSQFTLNTANGPQMYGGDAVYDMTVPLDESVPAMLDVRTLLNGRCILRKMQKAGLIDRSVVDRVFRLPRHEELANTKRLLSEIQGLGIEAILLGVES